MKRFLLVIVILLSLIGVGYCADSTQVGFFQSIYNSIKTDFLPTLKNQVFPILIDALQALIMTIFLAIITFFATWLKSKTDISKIDDEIDAGEVMLKALLIDTLNSVKYKELKEKYTKGEITWQEFAMKAGLEFKDPLLHALETKTTSLGKSLMELATIKFGDGKKYFSGKIEEFLTEAKKK
jgi:hypothetical protein